MNEEKEKFLRLLQAHLDKHNSIEKEIKTLETAKIPKISLRPEDYDSMIDQALATKDEQWFMELVEKKQLVTKKA